ncbi:MAG: hypothetical protein ACREK3_04720 [Gemmatimonadota bacterium]
MNPPSELDFSEEWKEILEQAREKIADRLARDERAHPEGGAEADFRGHYDRLLEDLRGFLEEIPQVEHEPHGPTGLRIRFDPTDREVRMTALEDQALVHFVFGHTTLGTLHRAEHHAARPFGDRPPDVPRLLRQILSFLIEGIEPRWLTHRPAPESPDHEGGPAPEVLELPLD